MAFQIRLTFFLFALTHFPGCRVAHGKKIENTQPTKSTKHGEVYRAKSEIDSLIYKLTLDLKTFNEKKSVATVMQKDAEKLARIAEKEIALLRPVQHLLKKLVTKENTSTGYRNCVANPGGKIQVLIKTTGSSLPKHYTIGLSVNHRELIDSGLLRENGDDFQVYYHDNGQHPFQIDRVISGLGTKSATVQFRLQAPISANTADDSSYSLVLGNAVSGSAMDNPAKVYAFYDDFSSATLSKEWAINWGKWSIQNGRLLGDTMQTKYHKGNVEVGLYVKSGFQWKDVEVELDMMETGNIKSVPGPFLRISNADLSRTAGWFVEYWAARGRKSALRPVINNRDSQYYYGKLPIAFKPHIWFHLKYQVYGDRWFSQWANGKLAHNKLQVGRGWRIVAGTVGLGCHISPHNCKTLYDNIKVRFLVATPPNITLGDLQAAVLTQGALLGEKKLPADSYKQVHDTSLVNNKPRAKNGVYWIKTDLQGSSAVQTYCDMKNGGWTLVGKISGKVGTIFKTWLVSNHKTAALKTPKLTKQKELACIDARSLAVEEASTILLSSGERADGLGSKWVMWRLPGDREKESFWTHSFGSSAVKAARQTPVMVYAWNGNKKVCYQNKYGILPANGYGGSYPYTAEDGKGNTAGNDLCMAVGVLQKGSSANGWTQDNGGYDSPGSDSDWPNRGHGQASHLSVWLK